MAGPWQFIRKAKELYSWFSFAAGIVTLAGAGLAVTVGGTVWLVKVGIPLPLALMAGYCTLVGTVYLAIAPVAFRGLVKRSGTGPATQKLPTVNYQAWGHVGRFTINQAAHLWCDIDPESIDNNDTRAWARALASAVQKGELKSLSVSGTPVFTRAALKDFAKLHGYDPRFLRDS